MPRNNVITKQENRKVYSSVTKFLVKKRSHLKKFNSIMKLGFFAIFNLEFF